MSNVRERILTIWERPQRAGLATLTQDGKPCYIEYVSPGVHEPEGGKAP